MKKISSGRLFIVKYIFPVLWLVPLVVMAFRMPHRDDDPGRWLFVILPFLMTLVGGLIFRKLIWDLADEVHDGGAFLVVRRRAEEETIPLDNIMNVSMSTFVNPPRITLTLSVPGRFGKEVSFSPVKPFSLNPFAKNPVAEDLIVRVDAARRGGAQIRMNGR